jgi:hypothetical protein
MRMVLQQNADTRNRARTIKASAKEMNSKLANTLSFVSYRTYVELNGPLTVFPCNNEGAL